MSEDDMDPNPTSNAASPMELKLLKVVKILKKTLVVSGWLLLVILILLGLSAFYYDYTFVPFTPIFTKDSFKTWKIGPFQLEMPQKLVRVTFGDFILTKIQHKGYEITLAERLHQKLSANIPFEKACSPHNLTNGLTPLGEIEIQDFQNVASVLYGPKNFDPKMGNYALVIDFEDGCLTLFSGVLGGKDPQERLAIFSGRFLEFLSNYGWLGENEAGIPGFKTPYGIIRQNEQYKIFGVYLFGESQHFNLNPYTISFTFFGFSPDDPNYVPLGESRPDISMQSRIRYFIRAIKHNKVFGKGFTWSLENEAFDFAGTCPLMEYRRMVNINRNIPKIFSIKGVPNGKLDENEMFYKFMLEIKTGNKGQPTNTLPYEILYTYWKRLIISAQKAQ
jgi:hypothetical protein